MATRVEKLLKSARRTLADPLKQRWSDDDLIGILSEGLEDFNQQTELLHEQADIYLVDGDPYFKLPDNCWKLTRVLYGNSALPMVTHRELDEMSCSHRYNDFGIFAGGSQWEIATGLPQAIIYDRRDFNQGKVYPIPKDLPTVEQLLAQLGVVSSDTEDDFGILTGAEDDAGNEILVEDIEGVASSIITPAPLRCYYLKNPQEVTDINSTIDTPPMYDIALKFYICGQAFLNDIDTGYQQKGAAQMMIYERHVKQAKKTSMQDAIRAGAFETTYRRGV